MSIFEALKAGVERVTGQKTPLPGPEFFKALAEDIKFTPDKWKLQRFEKVWLFVYGEEMMRHDKNVELMGLFEPEYTGHTFEDFSVWKASLGKNTHPIALQSKLDVEERNWFKQKKHLPRAKIKGELYSVPPELLFRLDNYRENGVVFERKRIEIMVPYRYSTFINQTKSFLDFRYKLQNIRAWMYVGRADYWSDRINDGASHGQFEPVRSFPNDNLKATYYYFTLAEYPRK